MKKKFWKLSSIVVLFCYILTGCSMFDSNLRKNELIKSVNDSQNINLDNYNTKYTKCEQNDDGTYSIYIYASPIQYEKDKKFYKIDNSIIDSDMEGYVYENKSNSIKTYFPKSLKDSFGIIEGYEATDFWIENVDEFLDAKKVSYNNIYGDTVSAIMYSRKDDKVHIYFYVNNAGIQVEYDISENEATYTPTIKVKKNENYYENNDNGYILLKRNNKNNFIIYSPIIKYRDDSQFIVNKNWNYSSSSNFTELKYLMDNTVEKATTLSFSIERYVNSMCDTSIYSRFNVNSYLRNIAVVGKHSALGEGWDLLQFRAGYYLAMDIDNVLKAGYYVKDIESDETNKELAMYKNAEFWSSSQILWDTRIKSGEKCAKGVYQDKGWIEFDVTDYFKKCLQDTTLNTELNGIVIKSENENYAVLASSDNNEYIPYIKIDVKKLPDFYKCENINP